MRSSLRSGCASYIRVVSLADDRPESPGGPYGGTVSGSDGGNVVPAEVAGELRSLRAENARLLRLLKLTPREAAPPGPAQAGFFEAPPGAVHAGSPPR